MHLSTRHSRTTLLLAIAATFVGLAFGLAQSRKQERAVVVEEDFLREAILDVHNRAAGAAVEAASGTDGAIEATRHSSEAAFAAPPPGASHHGPAREATSVEISPTRFPLAQGKARPEADTGAVSNSPQSAPASDAWRQVAYSSGAFTPQSGLDPALAARSRELQAAGRRSVYGFLLLNEDLGDEAEKELRAAGVTLLGPHGSLHKAKFPANLSGLESVARFGFVEWIGFPLPAQKLSVELAETLSAAAARSTVDELPVVINLFDDDTDQEFKRELQSAGAVLGNYDTELRSYSAVVSRRAIDDVTRMDFVLFMEIVQQSTSGHDQSMAAMGVDYIRPGGAGTRFNGASTTLGILDTGFMLGTAAPTMHQDLNKNGCGINFTSDAAGVWNDQNGHGTHVLGTISGTGTANSKFRGVGIGLGSSGTNRIRAAKVWRSTGSGNTSWTRDAMDFMDDATACGSPRPQVINLSGGSSGSSQRGTDSTSRKLDGKTWSFGQTYVVCVGNSGPGAESVWSPGVAKNALTVGNALDNGYLTVGDITNGSSRGATGDGRMKPNVVAPGNLVTSARAGTTNQYTNKQGCSMATPHVSGLAATLLQHYPDFRGRPYLLRAHLMASAIPHDDVTTPANNNNGGRNTYGLGRVASYVAHWARNNANGWSSHWTSGTVTNTNWRQRDITVPAGTRRLVVVATWDEPAASAGASAAVIHDLDLWVDRGADCVPDAKGQCGEYASQSYVDNVEYLVINNPPAGVYRLKAIPWRAPSSGVPAAIAATVIRGDTTPEMTLTGFASTPNPAVGATFTVTTTVSNPAYVASGVHIARTSFPAGLTFVGSRTTREDGVNMGFGTASGLTLGDIRQADSRSVIWTFRNTSAGGKTLSFRAWSENGGTRLVSVIVGPSSVFATDDPATSSQEF